MKRIIPAMTALALALPAHVSLSAAPPTGAPIQAAQDMQEMDDESERIGKSIEVINELMKTPDEGIPAHLFERAEAVVVIPSLVKGGFIIGAKHGKGVVSVRDRESNTWSTPAFVNMTGGSIGWQIGLESVDLVLLVMNRDGVTELLEDRFTLGGAASVAAGPVGRQADAATNAQFDAKILAYSRAKGLFAGATLEGASLHVDDSANEDFYDIEDVEITDVLKRPVSSAPRMAATWQSTLGRITSSPRD